MKKSGIIFITVFAIFLELLPYGAVLIFAPSPVDTIKETYSYFSLVPVGYANSAPFVTAILTCILLALQIAEIITNYRFIRKIPPRMRRYLSVRRREWQKRTAPYFSVRSADMNRQNGWGSVPPAKSGIPLWRRKSA